MRTGWCLTLAMCALAGGLRAGPDSAEPAPETAGGTGQAQERRLQAFYTRQDRFEIITANPADAQPALALGRSVWNALAVPLGLPREGFSSPVSVRLVPAGQWPDATPFLVTVEPPGRVMVRLRWADDLEPSVARRAFVQGLILRQAVDWHGVARQLTVPLWLEQACASWVAVRERPAMLDAFQQESLRLDAPQLEQLLRWQRGEVESRRWELASLWLLLQLQAEEGGAARWQAWLRGITGGADPVDLLPRVYSGLWTDRLALERWWRVAFHHQRRVQTRPGMTVAETRSWLADRSRWLAVSEGRERVLPLAELVEWSREPWVRTALQERLAQTRSVLGVLHPYYSNAALSLGQLYEAALRRNPKNFEAALAAFERDAVDGRDLEDTVSAILDTAPRR